MKSLIKLMLVRFESNELITAFAVSYELLGAAVALACSVVATRIVCSGRRRGSLVYVQALSCLHSL